MRKRKEERHEYRKKERKENEGKKENDIKRKREKKKRKRKPKTINKEKLSRGCGLMAIKKKSCDVGNIVVIGAGIGATYILMVPAVR